MIDIKNPWNEKPARPCAVLDSMCAFRECLYVVENKGSFTPGRGYTSTIPPEKRKLVCGRREYHGCPHPIPEPDKERMRCCPSPNFPEIRKGRRPFYQTCRTCGTKFSTSEGVIDIVKALPKFPVTGCKHEDTYDWLLLCQTIRRCRRCKLFFKKTPVPFERGFEHVQMIDILSGRCTEEYFLRGGVT